MIEPSGATSWIVLAFSVASLIDSEKSSVMDLKLRPFTPPSTTLLVTIVGATVSGTNCREMGVDSPTFPPVSVART